LYLDPTSFSPLGVHSGRVRRRSLSGGRERLPYPHTHPKVGGGRHESRLRDTDLFRCPRRAAARVRLPVRDGDDIHRVHRVAVAVPDLQRSFLALDLKGNLSHLVLRLVRLDARRSTHLVPDLRMEDLGGQAGEPGTSVMTAPEHDNHTECGTPNGQPDRHDPQRRRRALRSLLHPVDGSQDLLGAPKRLLYPSQIRFGLFDLLAVRHECPPGSAPAMTATRLAGSALVFARWFLIRSGVGSSPERSPEGTWGLRTLHRGQSG